MTETIIIVGAGAAGLMAAGELSARGKKIILLEGNNHTGGRIHTIQPSLFPQPIEAGSEFIHGKLPVTLQLLKEANIFYQPVEGKMSRVENGKWNTQDDFTIGWDELIYKMESLEKDMTVADFLQQNFGDEKYAAVRKSVQRFAEGFDLADINKASVFAIRTEWANEQDEQYRIPGGYYQLVHYLHQQCQSNGCTIHTSCIVKKITWKKNEVKIVSAGGEEFTGNKVIITVPAGVLQAPATHSTAISFDPLINEYMQAAASIGFGSVIKILLQFKEPFWKAYTKNLGFVISEVAVPTWWTQLPDNNSLLTGWLGGPLPASLFNADENHLLQLSLQSLAVIFNKEIDELKQLLVASDIVNWHNNKFSLGAYSYATLNTGDARKLLNTPLQETIYFAGEAVYDGPADATVEAALVSGQHVAAGIM